MRAAWLANTTHVCLEEDIQSAESLPLPPPNGYIHFSGLIPIRRAHSVDVTMQAPARLTSLKAFINKGSVTSKQLVIVVSLG